MPQLTSSSPTERSWLRPALLLFVFALAARWAPVLMEPDLGIGLDDMFQYDMLARSLAEGDGFRWYAPPDLERLLTALEKFEGVNREALQLPQDPRGLLTSFRAPLYPALLSLFYRIAPAGERFFLARLGQAPLTASLAPMAYLLARQLKATERWARSAGVTVALWPLLVAFPLALATENLFIPLVTLGLLSLLWADRSGRTRRYWLPGAALGLAAITRSVIMGFPLLAALWTWRSGRRRAAIVLLLPLMLLTIPWSVRNTMLHDRLTFVESSLGYNLYIGYHPDSEGTFTFGPSLDLVTILDDAERDQMGRQLAWQYIREDPGRVPELMLRKLGHFWGLEDRAFTYLYSNGLFGPLPPALVMAIFGLLVLPLVVVLPLATVGWLGPPHGRAWQLIGILLAWYVGVHLLIMAEERFHLVLVPLLTALAARALTRGPQWLARLRQGDRRLRLLSAVAAALICLALLNWGLELHSNAGRIATIFSESGWQANLRY